MHHSTPSKARMWQNVSEPNLTKGNCHTPAGQRELLSGKQGYCLLCSSLVCCPSQVRQQPHDGKAEKSNEKAEGLAGKQPKHVKTNNLYLQQTAVSELYNSLCGYFRKQSNDQQMPPEWYLWNLTGFIYSMPTKLISFTCFYLNWTQN